VHLRNFARDLGRPAQFNTPFGFALQSSVAVVPVVFIREEVANVRRGIEQRVRLSAGR
jgi:hypothetical protein